MIVATTLMPGAGTRLGSDDPTPALAWTLTGATGEAQTAYQVQVGTTLDGSDVWDSGKVASTGQTVEVRAQLASRTRYFWRVRAWDAADVATPWAADWWETGLWSRADWHGAEWIGRPGNAAPQLRREVPVTKPIRSARLYVAAAGYAEVVVNGVRVSDPLSPGTTVFNKRVQYVTYDLDDLADAVGDTVPEATQVDALTVGITLGRGFYGCTTVTDWNWSAAPWHGDPRCRVLLAVTYIDDTEDLIVSDVTWATIGGPTTADSVYLGDYYDARLETPGWTLPGFDPSAWSPATVMAAPTHVLAARGEPPIRARAPIAPTSLTEVSPGVWRATFPKVTAGWVRVTMTVAADTPVSIAYGERLTAGGALYMANGAVTGTQQTDTYIGPAATVTWEPRFSYKGFRFVEVTGAVAVSAVEMIQVSTDLAETGTWTSSNALLNQLAAMAANTIAINCHGIVTDTPQREKNGWLGDALVTAGAAGFAFDMHALWRKWLTDMADSVAPSGLLPDIIPNAGFMGGHVAPDWQAAMILIAHRLWRATGDLTVPAQRYYDLRRYVDYWLVQTSNKWEVGFGDWSMPAGNSASGGTDLTGTSAVIEQALAWADLCDALGVDSSGYHVRAAAAIADLNARLLDADTGTYKPTATYAGALKQTPTLLAIQHGYMPAESRSAGVAAIEADVRVTNAGHLNTGILGDHALLDVLTVEGYADTAYGVATKTDYPSWGQWAAAGATTCWNYYGPEVSQGTLSHHMHASYLQWFYERLAGIVVDSPSHVTIAPHHPTGLASVAATAQTLRGPVAVEWDATEITFTIPPGITATYDGTNYGAGTHTITR